MLAMLFDGGGEGVGAGSVVGVSGAESLRREMANCKLAFGRMDVWVRLNDDRSDLQVSADGAY